MNQIALAFIKQHESCRLTAYRDSGGVWTVGYGSTGNGIGPGTMWTQAQADADVAKRVDTIEASIGLKTSALRLSQQQYAALISLAFNIGPWALSNSHALAFVLARNWIMAAKSILTWDHVDGVELQGLLKRRMEEAALFLEGST